MKLYLVVLGLSLVPLVFAAPPPLAKLVWSDGHVITNSSGEATVMYKRTDSLLEFSYWNPNFAVSHKMILSDRNGDLRKSSFVAEWLVGSALRRETEAFCMSASSSEFKPLIKSCSGRVKLRALNEQEKAEMDAFKSEVIETGHNYNIVYDKNSIVSKTVDLDFFSHYTEKNYLQLEAKRNPDIYMWSTFRNCEGKQFVVRGPGADQCKPKSLGGLKVNCIGEVEIVPASEADLNGGNRRGNRPNENKPNENKPNESKPNENKPNESKPAIPSLDDLSPDQLKSLLKDILGRL